MPHNASTDNGKYEENTSARNGHLLELRTWDAVRWATLAAMNDSTSLKTIAASRCLREIIAIRCNGIPPVSGCV